MKKGLFAISMATIAVLYGLLVVIAIIAVKIAGGSVLFALGIAVIILIIQFLISPWITDLTQKWFYKTQFGYEVPEYLREFIEKTCSENKIKYPKIGYIDDGAPNAFTYGRTKRDARIVLTRGIFELLDEEEVKAVVAHELGHVAHLDMLVMTAVQLVPMVLYALYEICINAAKSSGKNSDDNKGAAALAVFAIVILVLYIISEYIILFLSRRREYYADEFACFATDNPSALSAALVNIGFGLSTHPERADGKKSVSSKSTATMGIFDSKSSKSLAVNCYVDGKIDKQHIKNAMKWELWNVWAKLYEISSTHPLISKRILRIDKTAKAMNKEEYINFDLKKPESYADDFVGELAIFCLPAIVTIAAIVTTVITAANTSDGIPPMWTLGFPALIVIASIIKYRFSHPTKEYSSANVAGLLAEVKVSGVRSIPCELTGTFIGRGDPGCIFNEDYVIQDETGILFIDYNQPLWIINKVVALFKTKKNLDKKVTVKGWYRRSPVPYLELYSMNIDGKEKKCYSYGFGLGVRIVLLVLALALIALPFVMPYI